MTSTLGFVGPSRCWVAALALAFLLGSAHGAAGDGDGPARWSAFCNYECPWKDCPTPAEFDIVPCKRTIISYSCAYGTSECPQKWTFGAWPLLNANGTAPARNGGVPQNANLSLHLDLIRRGVDAWAPDRDFDGNMVLDWEAWTPNWEFCDSLDPNWMSDHYTLYSMELVWKRHPDWNLTQVAAQAREEFRTAGLRFMSETLRVLRELRPRAKIGYYGYPRIVNLPCTAVNGSLLCGYDDPTFGPIARAANDFLEPIWNHSTALYPSVYLSPQHSYESFPIWQWYLRTTVAMTMAESVRVVQSYSPAIPILPYHWSFYHNGTTTLLAQDLDMILNQTFIPPFSTGLVLWGGGGADTEDQLPSYLKSLEGPLFLNASSFAHRCSVERCNGHGWCDSLVPEFVSRCVCDKGYQGPDCRH